MLMTQPRDVEIHTTYIKNTGIRHIKIALTKVDAAEVHGEINSINIEPKFTVDSKLQCTYGILRSFKNFKRFTPYKVPKSLAESLVLSRLNYVTSYTV